MLIVVVPVIVMALLFAWRYRASNRTARYAPTWAYSAKIDAVVWLVPALIVIAVGVLVWRSTHKLDPYREIVSDVPPLDIQVVAQDWKWLFIYPEAGHRGGEPDGDPQRTADQPSDHLRHGDEFLLRARARPARSTPWPACRRACRCWPYARQFVGRNTQYSGGGFSDQFFEVLATSPADFDAWVAKARQAPGKLDAAAYAKLAEKSRLVPIAYYSAVEPRLFDSIIAKYTHAHQAPAATPPPAEPARR